jgi:signal transduction histidine kinase
MGDEAQSNLPRACADENRISQVLGNLIGNAIKFTPEHGKITVRVEFASGADCLRVSVIDTGRGIPKEDLEHIFDRLYQVSENSNGSNVGLGLGLNLCKELIESHGGEIWAESDLGKGSMPKYLPQETSSAEERIHVP